MTDLRQSKKYMMENFTLTKKVKDSNELSRKIRTNTIKPNETIILDERRKNQFDVSFGNIKVLRLIPDMMNDIEFRDKLRMLALEFMTARRI